MSICFFLAHAWFIQFLENPSLFHLVSLFSRILFLHKMFLLFTVDVIIHTKFQNILVIFCKTFFIYLHLTTFFNRMLWHFVYEKSHSHLFHFASLRFWSAELISVFKKRRTLASVVLAEPGHFFLIEREFSQHISNHKFYLPFLKKYWFW